MPNSGAERLQRVFEALRAVLNDDAKMLEAMRG